MRAVIIGGTGFLGYFTCRDLIAAGHEAVAVGLALPDPGTMPDGAVVEVCNADSCLKKTGGPDRIRTCDPQFRKLMLYPAELRDLRHPFF